MMRITIELPKDLEQNLIQQAAELNLPLETLILQSLRQATTSTSWSDLVLSYEGTPDFPSLESYRAELLPTQELELF
ncbi:hypothetical protein [Leptolyngbya sp. UWPOB_LEPTO1]|uniref:hypothetical protein n=1 Tax=Leptolyngbya sp. UWPOB_LEPTO1 TaxID=2815653 RepID=UPI00257BE500|nr:hypothetical protein [Leptolyngbya sp. UWPOB_LEPTO1]